MNLGLSSKRNEESEQNLSQIRISVDGQINGTKTQSQDINTLLNELKIIGHSHIPKGAQLNRFDSIFSKISELITKQQQMNDFQRRRFADENGWQKKNPSSPQYNLRGTLDRQIAEVRPRRPFMRQGISVKGKLPQSLKKRERAEQNAQQIINVRPTIKQGAKYTKFIPTLRVKSPQPKPVAKLSRKQLPQQSA